MFIVRGEDNAEWHLYGETISFSKKNYASVNGLQVQIQDRRVPV